MEAGQGLNNLFTSAQQSGMPILIYRNVVHVNWGIFPVIKLLRPDLTLSPIPMTFIISYIGLMFLQVNHLIMIQKKKCPINKHGNLI